MKSFLSGLIAERHHASHPQPLALGGADLVADTLAGDLALELGEGQQHVQRQPAHAGRRVEGLRDTDERDAVAIEHLHELGEVHERAAQPVDQGALNLAVVRAQVRRHMRRAA